MTTLGGILLFLTFFSIVIIFIFHYFVVKKFYIAKRIVNSYFFWAFFSILFLIYFFLLRWYSDFTTLYSYNLEDLKKQDLYTYSFLVSKTWLLDLCPMVFVTLPFSLIIDKTRNIAKVIAPFSMIGGFLTIISSFWNETLDPGVNFMQYIFYGQGVNKIFFSTHYLSLMLGICVLLNSKTFTKWSVLGNLVFISCFIGYIAIFMKTMGVMTNTTGLSKYDWVKYENTDFWYSQYSILYNFFYIEYPYCVVVFYSFVMIFVFLIMTAKNLLTKDEEYISKRIGRWYRNISFLYYKLMPLEVKLEVLFG